MRRRIPIVVEALAGYRMGKAVRISQAGGDGTDRKQVALNTFGVRGDFENTDGSLSRMSWYMDNAHCLCDSVTQCNVS